MLRVLMQLSFFFSRFQAWEFHTQLESRIQRITGGFAGGLKRLTSVTSSSKLAASKVKKDEMTKVVNSNLPKAVVEQATLNHISIVKEVRQSSNLSTAFTSLDQMQNKTGPIYTFILRHIVESQKKMGTPMGSARN